MYKKLDNDAWREYLDKFESIKDTMTVKDFCAENNLKKSQFYYHKKKLENTQYLLFMYPPYQIHLILNL